MKKYFLMWVVILLAVGFKLIENGFNVSGAVFIVIAWFITAYLVSVSIVGL